MQPILGADMAFKFMQELGINLNPKMYEMLQPKRI